MEEGSIDKDMTPKLIGDLGMRYPTEKSKHKTRLGIYECQYCGKEFEARTSNVKQKHTKSCGCQKINTLGTTHGLGSHKFYGIWNSMVQRCNNLKSKGYKHYGGRGIKVCEEWLDVRNFIEWCDSTYPNIEGYTLDRIDNDKGYSPENCRWANRVTQSINKRKREDNTSGYVGVVSVIGDKYWAANIGINNKLKHIGQFKTIEEAVLARDNYIIQNNLPHKLSIEYKSEESL